MSTLACGDMLRDGMRYFCDCCPRCVDTKNGFVPLRVAAEAPHAAETLGELAALRAEVAGLKALVVAFGELRADDNKCVVELAIAGRSLGCSFSVLKASLVNVTELWAEEKNRYAALDNLTRELDCRVRAIEHKLNLI